MINLLVKLPACFQVNRRLCFQRSRTPTRKPFGGIERSCPQLMKIIDPVAHNIRRHNPFSLLNPSHASFSVAKTAALIILCSVVAVVGNCIPLLALPNSTPFSGKAVVAYLVGMHLPNPFHIHHLDLARQDQLPHADLLPSTTFPQYGVQTSQ